MTHIVKKILTILIIVNLVSLIFLICIRSKFVTKNPMFGTVINSIIKNEDSCKRFNMSSDDIFDYYGKSILFNVYNLDDSKYKSNLNLVSNITTERLNINVVDIIFYEKKNIDKVKNFVAKNSINRPVLYVEKSFLSKKLSLNSNSLILSDLNMDNVVKLKSFDYKELEENVDFDYNDLDEVKDTYYESFLKLLYPSVSDLKDKKMEYWNMHTYSNKVIDSSKISLLKDKDEYSASKILKQLIDDNILYVKQNLDFLYEYYNYFYN